VHRVHGYLGWGSNSGGGGVGSAARIGEGAACAWAVVVGCSGWEGIRGLDWSLLGLVKGLASFSSSNLGGPVEPANLGWRRGAGAHGLPAATAECERPTPTTLQTLSLTLWAIIPATILSPPVGVFRDSVPRALSS
jgi:hypothetical protein